MASNIIISKTTRFALKLRYLRPEIANMLSNFTMSEFINYFIQLASADDRVRRDFKSLRNSSCQLFKASHIQDPKVKVGCHWIIIIIIVEFDDCYVFKLKHTNPNK